MTISAVGSTAATLQVNNNLGIQDFLKILLTQITYQDPLKPMDNQQFMAQMAQFTTLQQTQQLNTNIETLINNQSSLQSVGLIGKTVDVTTASGNVTGKVTALSLAGTSPLITISTLEGAVISGLSLGQIVAVQ